MSSWPARAASYILVAKARASGGRAADVEGLPFVFSAMVCELDLKGRDRKESMISRRL